MSKTKKIILSILGIADLIILVVTIGYLIMGIKTPDSLAGRELQFTGGYILCLTYFMVFAVITTVFLICLLRWKAKGKNNEKMA